MAKVKGIWIDKNTFMKFSEKPGFKLTDEIASRKRSVDFYSLGTLLPNPDSTLKKNGKDITVYEELSVDPHVESCLTSRKAGVTSLCWEIGRGLKKTKEMEILETRLRKLKIHSIIEEILDAVPYGYKPIEVIWENSTGLWLPGAIIGKPPEWFVYDMDNNLRFRSRDSYYEGELLPEKKFLCPRRMPTYKNPYGKPVLSSVFWPVAFKKGGWQFWITFLEKYGMPTLLGKHQPGASDEEIAALELALENAIQDAVIVISQNSDIQVIESPFKAASTGAYKEFTGDCNSEISKAILGQTLTTEVGSTGGNRAIADVHFEVRGDIVVSDKNLPEDSFNTITEWTYELNWANQDVPKFEMWEPEDVDQALADRDKTLTETGVKFTKKYYQKNHNLEDEDFEVVTPQPQQNTAPPVQFSELPQSASPDKELQQIGEKILKPVIDLVQNSNSYEQVMESLSEQYPKMPTQDLESLLERAMFAGEAAGVTSNITK